MQIGIMTYINCKHADVREQFEMFKKLGVHRTFLSGGHPRLGEVMELLPKYDIICDNFHSEFDGAVIGKNISMGDLRFKSDAGDLMLERLFFNVLNCEKYRVPILVVHSPYGDPKNAFNEISDERYIRLGDFAREHGVTLAFENISHYENLEHTLSLIPDSKFCWDIGHQHCFGDRKKVMPSFGHRLAALHIHDNNLENDDHMIPFEGKINFDEAAKELADSGYEGTLMLELLYKGQLPTEEYYTKAANAAKKLVDMVASYK